MNALTILTEARELISDFSRWYPGVGVDGRFCAYDATWEIGINRKWPEDAVEGPPETVWRAHERANDYLGMALYTLHPRRPDEPMFFLTSLNDGTSKFAEIPDETRHKMILAVYDKAIELCRAESGTE